MKTKFKYLDEVKIIDGFWEGYDGVVTDCVDDDIQPYHIDREYRILLDLPTNTPRDTYIKESRLRKK